MRCSVHECAPAKLNFNLRVLPKRADGYHDIESIFQTVPLCDELLIEMADSYGCDIRSACFDLPPENTLTKAYSSFCAQTGFVGGVRVTLAKRIPSGGGLGGGSSDAAAMVRGLERLAGIRLSQAQRYQIASEIGSDVFFFLLRDGLPLAAVVTGRGETVRYIEPRRDLSYVLVCPGIHSSTAQAYSLVDGCAPGNEIGFPTLAELENMYRGSVEKWAFRNSFTEPLAGEYPEIDHALQNLLDTHAQYAEMSGSGSVVFGVYESFAEAETAYTHLCRDWEQCFLLNAGGSAGLNPGLESRL